MKIPILFNKKTQSYLLRCSIWLTVGHVVYSNLYNQYLRTTKVKGRIRPNGNDIICVETRILFVPH